MIENLELAAVHDEHRTLAVARMVAVRDLKPGQVVFDPRSGPRDNAPSEVGPSLSIVGAEKVGRRGSLLRVQVEREDGSRTFRDWAPARLIEVAS